MKKNSKAPSEIETVTVTMSRPVAEAVQIACEWYLRLHMGQFRDLCDDLCMAKYYADLKNDVFSTKELREKAFDLSIRYRNAMEEEMDRLYSRYVLPAPISSLMRIPYRAEIVWLTLRYALAWHDNPEGVAWCVDYQKPMNRSDQPMPVVELTEAQGEKTLPTMSNAQSIGGAEQMPKKRLIDANAFERSLETMESTLRGAPRGEDKAGAVCMVRKMLAAAPTVLPVCMKREWHPANSFPPLYEKPFEDDDGKIIQTSLSDPLLIMLNDGEMRIAQFDGDYWFDGSGMNYNQDITHWMPLPEPPEV